MSLQLKNVGKRFEDSGHETLTGIDLEIEKGEFVCVVGKSGCGKSTLLNLIAGLEKPSFSLPIVWRKQCIWETGWLSCQLKKETFKR